MNRAQHRCQQSDESAKGRAHPVEYRLTKWRARSTSSELGVFVHAHRRPDGRRHLHGIRHSGFRGPQGVWTKNPKAEKLSNIHYYMSDPEVRRLAWQQRLDHPAWHAKPNAGHHALAELERAGRLHALITQNIDGLHQKAGNSPDTVIEVHGRCTSTCA